MPPDDSEKPKETNHPNPQEHQSAKEWFLRGLDMAVLPFTDPARAWAGFRKEILNVKGGIFILLLVVFGFVVHYVDSCMTAPTLVSKTTAKSVSTNTSNSPVTQINQSSNVAVNNNSGNAAFNNQGGATYQVGSNNFFANQGAIIPANNGNVNIIYNPVYTTPPDVELRAWVTQVNQTATFASNGILITKTQLAQLSALLTKLDERTEDVQKLPDGRTSLGGIIVGVPRILISDTEAAVGDFSNKDYGAALKHIQKAVNDFESCPSNYLDERIYIKPITKEICYLMATYSAGILGSNELAYNYAIKLNSIDNKSETNIMYLAFAQANLAVEKYRANDYTNAFALYSSAIKNYEGIITNNSSLGMTKEDELRLYVQALKSALETGKTNEALEYSKKVSEKLGKLH